MKISVLILFLLVVIFPQIATAQSKLSPTVGLFYNGTSFKEDVHGMGLILGLEYMTRKDHFFSTELRTKFGYYSFDDGTKWDIDDNGALKPPVNLGDPRLEYKLFAPQVGVVPKFHYVLDESISFFVENDFSIGIMAGKFNYIDKINHDTKKNFTDFTFAFNVGLGCEVKENKWSLLGSIGYSTLNFKDKIKKHQPLNYQGYIPNQNAGLYVNIIFKFPLCNK